MAREPSDDLYEVLGVPRSATRSEIKAAWMKGVRQYHPDMGGDTADEVKFQAVQEAYDVLSAEDTREAYDGTLEPDHAVVTPTGQPDTSPGWDGSSAPVPPPPGSTAPQAYASTSPPRKHNIKPSYGTPDGFRPASDNLPPQPGPAWRARIPKHDHVNLVPGWKSAWAAALLTGAVAATTWHRAVSLTFLEPVSWLATIAVVAVAVLAAGSAVTVLSRRRRKMSHAAELSAMVAALLMVFVAMQTGEPGTAKAAVISAGSGLVFAAALAYGVYRQRAVSRVLSYKQAKDFRVFGKPGAHASTAAGRLVQISTGDAVKDFLDLPNVKIAHHVRIPVDPKTAQREPVLMTAAGEPVRLLGSVDTAVLAGRRLLLMDSAVVPAGDYSVDEAGNIHVDGVQAIGVSIRTLAEARVEWQKLLGRKATVEAALVLYADGPHGKVLTEGLPVAVLPDDIAFDAAGKFVADDIRTVDRRLVNELYARTSG